MFNNKKNIVLILSLIVLSILIFLIFKSKVEPVNYPPKNQTIVAFGDSLIRGVGSSSGGGFISLISNRIGRSIVNMGVPGETSADGLSRINEIIEQKPGTVILLFGGNDYLKKVPQTETFNNLKEIITKLQSSGSMVVLLGIRGGLLNDKFDSDFEKLAKETRSIYVPDVLDGLLADSRYMSDAVHPNDAGYIKIADKVYKAMENYIK